MRRAGAAAAPSDLHRVEAQPLAGLRREQHDVAGPLRSRSPRRMSCRPARGARTRARRRSRRPPPRRPMPVAAGKRRTSRGRGRSRAARRPARRARRRAGRPRAPGSPKPRAKARRRHAGPGPARRPARVEAGPGRIADAAVPACACWPNGRPGRRMNAIRLPSPDQVGLVSRSTLGDEERDRALPHVVDADEAVIAAVADERELRAVGRPAAGCCCCPPP